MTDSITFFNFSQSDIELQNESFNSSSSSFRSLNSFADLLSKNKTIEDPSFVLLNNNNIYSSPLSLQSSISRNILTRNVLRNPYISPAIKLKMNDLISDSNIGQTTFNRYQYYSNSNCKTRKTATPTSARLTDFKFTPRKSFTSQIGSTLANSNTNAGINTSIKKMNQMKSQMEKTNGSIIYMSNNYANSCRNNNKDIYTPRNYLLNTFRQTNSIIVGLKKKYIPNKEIIYNKKIAPFLSKNYNKDVIKKNNLQVLSTPQYTSRLFMFTIESNNPTCK